MIKPKPNLIPRFKEDYRFEDLVYAIKATSNNKSIDIKPIRKLFGEKDLFFTNYARTALYVILKSMDLPPGSNIGVPLYSCTVVFDAILKAGHVPRFIDIDPDNYTLDPKDLEDKIKELEAVIVIHTFGRLANMDEIEKIAEDKPVIEDCAHAFLSRYKNKMAGSIGCASAFSLSKYVSSGGGGMIVLNDSDYKEIIKEEIARLIEPSRTNEIRNALINYLRSFFYQAPWFGMFSLPIGMLLENKIDLMNKRDFIITKIRKSEQMLTLNKLEYFEKCVEKQRKNSFLLLQELKDTSLKLPYEERNTFFNFYMFPIKFENKKARDLACNILRKKGIDSAKLYHATPFVSRKFYGYSGDCPNSEKCADNLLVIPNYYTLKEDELMKIIRVLKNIT